MCRDYIKSCSLDEPEFEILVGCVADRMALLVHDYGVLAILSVLAILPMLAERSFLDLISDTTSSLDRGGAVDGGVL
jgi:hypothetical protein